MNRVEPCHHSWYTHLFKEPFCPQADLATRVSVAVFHLFTLCIPAIINYIMTCCFSNEPINGLVVEDSDSDSDSEMGDPPLLIVGNASHYAISEGNEALAEMQDILPDQAYEEFERLCDARDPDEYSFAQDRVRIKDLDTESGWRVVPVIGPRSEHAEPIRLALTLYFELLDELREEFLDLSPHGLALNNPWHTPALQAKAYRLLQVATIISCLTLEDVSTNGEQRAARLLNQPDYYAKSLIYMCSSMYHHIRCGDLYCEPDERPLGFYPASLLHLPSPGNWGHVQFESEAYGPHATFHVKCRVLFSLQCMDIREKFSEETLNEKLQDLSKWHPKVFLPSYTNSIFNRRPPEFISH